MKIHQIDGYIQSIFLVEYPDKLLLLDGCCRCDVAKVEGFIEGQLKKDKSQLKLVVVTHMHPDHAGGALYFRAWGAKIASAYKSQQWYRGIKGSLQHCTDIFLAYAVANRQKKPWRALWYDKTLVPDLLLNDQDRLPGFEDWLAIEAPGHTDRDISLYNPSSADLYVADNILKPKDKFIPPFPIVFKDLYQASIAKYKTLSVGRILMAHGGSSSFQPSVVDAVLIELKRREQSPHPLLTLIKVFAKSAFNKGGR